MKKLLLLWFVLLGLLATTEAALAVPPPDFLFNLGSSLIQVFSVAALFLSALFTISYKYIKTKLTLIKSKKVFYWIGSAIMIIVVSVGTAFFYGEYKQSSEYNKWLEESQLYAQLPEEQEEYFQEKILREGTTPSTNIEKLLRDYEIDKLKIGASVDTPEISEGGDNFISHIDESINDANTAFIKEYYSAIANGELNKAYELSKKSSSLETFKGWYVDTEKITLDDLIRIDESTSSLELTLYENSGYTRYGTVISLKLEDDIPVQVASSQVRILGEGTITVEITEADDDVEEFTVEETYEEDTFFTQNRNDSLSVSNNELQDVLDSNRNDYVILDAREDLEYKNGHFPDSTHIRFADLQAGKWIEVPADKYVFVLCWSGIRGKEVAEFLRDKNIIASYLETGANGWVEDGGTWVGNIKFSQQYTADKYIVKLSTEEVKEKLDEGVFLVDSREPWKFNNWHIEGSVNIPIMYTPTINITEAFAQVPNNSTVITVCDDYVNCFDAKVTAVELEERGHEFIGRYVTPWEYEE